MNQCNGVLLRFHCGVYTDWGGWPQPISFASIRVCENGKHVVFPRYFISKIFNEICDTVVVYHTPPLYIGNGQVQRIYQILLADKH